MWRLLFLNKVRRIKDIVNHWHFHKSLLICIFYPHQKPLMDMSHLSNNTVHSYQPRPPEPPECWNEVGKVHSHLFPSYWHAWQAGKHPEMSLFAQTVLEQERNFYRQFPEAKQAYIEQWSYPPAFHGVYSKSQPCFEYYEKGNTLSVASHYPEPVYVPPSLDPSIHAAPTPYTPHLVQHHGHGNLYLSRHLSSQVTLKNKTPLSNSVTPSKQILPLVPTITVNNNSVQFTGDWATDAHAANECFLRASNPCPAKVPAIMVANQPVVNAPSTRHYHPTHQLRRAVRAQSYPYPKRNGLNSLSSRSSPAPVEAAKTKSSWFKVACHFCRHRKIACGVPPEGSTDSTCE